MGIIEKTIRMDSKKIFDAIYKKVLANLTDFHASLWAGQGQNTVCPWSYTGKLKKFWRLLHMLGV